MLLRATILATNDTIQDLISAEIQEYGYGCDLNHLDISGVTSLDGVFAESKFNGDISKWDTSNVKTMNRMFAKSRFNGDISNWNVCQVENFEKMFEKSIFNNDISKWTTNNAVTFYKMFHDADFNGDLSKWDVRSVEHFGSMFELSAFNGNLESWVLTNAVTIEKMFCSSSFTHDVSHWALDLSVHTRHAADPSLLDSWKVTPWVLKTHIESGSIPPDPMWQHLLKTTQIAEKALGDGFTPKERTELAFAMWDTNHRGHVGNSSFSPS